jgi:hypothetical protein
MEGVLCHYCFFDIGLRALYLICIKVQGKMADEEVFCFVLRRKSASIVLTVLNRLTFGVFSVRLSCQMPRKYSQIGLPPVILMFLVQGVMSNPHTSLHQKQRTHKYVICCHNTHNNGIFIILTRDFS